MNRFFVENISHGNCELSETVSRQIAVVLRMRPGERIVLLDNKGYLAEAIISFVDKKRVIVDIKKPTEINNEPNLKITLYQSLPKADKMAGIIRRCTELGVSAVQPVETARSVARLSEGRLERWREIVREAAEQCGRGLIPAVAAPVGFDAALAGLTEDKLLVCAPGGQSLKNYPLTTNHYSLFIGPEGGFDDNEIKALAAKGAKIIGLGPRILRCETAGTAALAVLMAMGGEWA
ncbi:MAG: 16S rRNA (uracil(1498)-N(3))-methyltransferase [Clostridia bacterium]|nr:16S rRNA (uracil(1498)-N(3))-methyltransferase [Clostridia bacterium]